MDSEKATFLAPAQLVTSSVTKTKPPQPFYLEQSLLLALDAWQEFLTQLQVTISVYVIVDLWYVLQGSRRLRIARADVPTPEFAVQEQSEITALAIAPLALLQRST